MRHLKKPQVNIWGFCISGLIKPDMAILRTSWLSCRVPQQATQDQA
jgi:hypothetical protein